MAAVLVIVVGILGAIGVGAIGFFRMSDDVDRYQRVTVPGSGDLQLAAGDYTVYFEYPGAATLDPPEAVRARLTDPTGQVVRTEAVGAEQSYQLGSREGTAEFTFHAVQDGMYVLETDGGPGITLAVGHDLGSSFAGPILLAVAIAITAIILGVAILIITAIRRAGSRRPPVIGSGATKPHPM
ncbi:hypothetical protein ACFWPK_18190 [Nocardia sp. NPDC058519]|uniref:hypothetical protein n=1 Tax=unclassified Nocardia TaxID=2637762 RepID=UPI003667FED2